MHRLDRRDKRNGGSSPPGQEEQQDTESHHATQKAEYVKLTFISETFNILGSLMPNCNHRKQKLREGGLPHQ